MKATVFSSPYYSQWPLPFHGWLSEVLLVVFSPARSESFHGHSFSPCLLAACRMLPGLLPLLPLSHQDSRPEVVLKDWRVGDGIGPRSHFSAPISALPFPDLSQLLAHRPKDSGWQIWRHGEACLCWCAEHLYMKQKACYLMEGPTNSRPAPGAIAPAEWGQASTICPGKTLFYQPTRAILAFTSFVEGPGTLPIEAWVSGTTLLFPDLTSWVPSFGSVHFFYFFLNRRWSFLRWCLRLLPRGFQMRLLPSN